MVKGTVKIDLEGERDDIAIEVENGIRAPLKGLLVMLDKILDKTISHLGIYNRRNTDEEINALRSYMSK
jgi:hypothetical protein